MVQDLLQGQDGVADYKVFNRRWGWGWRNRDWCANQRVKRFKDDFRFVDMRCFFFRFEYIRYINIYYSDHIYIYMILALSQGWRTWCTFGCLRLESRVIARSVLTRRIPVQCCGSFSKCWSSWQLQTPFGRIFVKGFADGKSKHFEVKRLPSFIILQIFSKAFEEFFLG